MSYQRDFKERLDIAVVGAGSHSYRNLLPAMTYLPVRLRAICDVNETLARSTAEQYAAKSYTSSAEMYAAEKLDGVFLSVSPQLHPKLSIEAFGAGVNVWLEKPPARRAGEITRMIAERGDCIAVVGLKKAFMPATRKVIELLGGPGGVESMYAQYPMTIPRDGAAVLADGRMINWLANGVHPLSLMLAVGGPVNAVTVVQSSNDSAACLLEFASGALGNFHLAGGGPGYFTHEHYVFFGKQSEVEIDNGLRIIFRRGIPFDYSRTVSYAPAGLDSGTIIWEPQNFLATLENKPLFTQGFYFSMRHFCDSVMAKKPSTQGTLEEARDVMRVYEAALLSNGRRVSIAEID